LGVLVASLAAEAQPAGKMPQVGILSQGSPSTSSPFHDRLREGLRELGYVEGQNIVIEYRWAEGKYDRLPELAAELVRLKVDLIVADGTAGVHAAQRTTSTIPIVMTSAGDPIRTGLVASLAKPGGNITGLSVFGPDIAGKQLELLKEVVPKLARVAVLTNPDNQVSEFRVKEIEASARVLRVQVQVVEARSINDFDSAFSAIAREHANALFVLPDWFFLLHRTRIADLAAKRHLPTMFGVRDFLEAGGLMAYGPDLGALFYRAATYVDKILKGAKPADLPVEQPTQFVLAINLKTAKALGLTIPQSVLLRADEIVR
jgi:putative ABC transport system substrate-binding protein